VSTPKPHVREDAPSAYRGGRGGRGRGGSGVIVAPRARGKKTTTVDILTFQSSGKTWEKVNDGVADGGGGEGGGVHTETHERVTESTKTAERQSVGNLRDSRPSMGNGTESKRTDDGSQQGKDAFSEEDAEGGVSEGEDGEERPNEDGARESQGNSRGNFTYNVGMNYLLSRIDERGCFHEATNWGGFFEVQANQGVWHGWEGFVEKDVYMLPQAQQEWTPGYITGHSETRQIDGKMAHSFYFSAGVVTVRVSNLLSLEDFGPLLATKQFQPIYIDLRRVSTAGGIRNISKKQIYIVPKEGLESANMGMLVNDWKGGGGEHLLLPLGIQPKEWVCTPDGQQINGEDRYGQRERKMHSSNAIFTTSTTKLSARRKMDITGKHTLPGGCERKDRGKGYQSW
jgi:hypothetical protein